MRCLFFLSALCPLLAVFAAQPMNVLFIAVDDMRPDLGCYGVNYAKTPNIDRLAARGIVFDKAYCAQAVCSPSRTAILTGLRPDVTKVWDLNTHFRAAQPDCVTLPQHFRQSGYHTVALGKLEHHGFEDGPSWSDPRWFASGSLVSVDPKDWTKHTVTSFDGVESEYANPVSKTEGKKNAKGKIKTGPAYEVSPKSDDELPDGATAAEAVKRLNALKAEGKPFFLAVGFVKPHLPFVAPKKYWDMHDADAIPLPAIDHMPDGTPDFVGHTNGELHSYLEVPEQNPIPAEFAKTLRHGYHACITYVDAQVGRLLDALEKEGLADNTVIVLWGDHGWQLGEHGLWHKHTNFEIAARSPLLISMPKSNTAGRHCAAPVEFVDVYPTLADVCGLPIPSGLGGSSLKPYLDNPDAPMQKPAISQYPKSSKDHGGSLMGYSVRTERWRCTFWRKRNGADIGFVELYDENNDPNETVNLADKPEHAQLIASLQKHLPPVGSDEQPSKSAKTVQKTKPKSGGYDPNEPRDKRYDRLYPGKAKLTLDDYLAGQGGDQAAAKDRFPKQDKDKDGFVSRDEFIGGAKK
ncbi:sulfatase [Prosthecobacter sp.]|uniref:sulfatase n=1 Tax=Prosthecobacter sp. TaxID=1965333 RepID=UPI001D48B2D4|nr:sulfatase [Prosthecobacter sp.]MCB1276747.1 sulfatase [Prosthecobacter sp.]